MNSYTRMRISVILFAVVFFSALILPENNTTVLVIWGFLFFGLFINLFVQAKLIDNELKKDEAERKKMSLKLKDTGKLVICAMLAGFIAFLIVILLVKFLNFSETYGLIISVVIYIISFYLFQKLLIRNDTPKTL